MTSYIEHIPPDLESQPWFLQWLANAINLPCNYHNGGEDFISCSFTWQETPEGHEFWENLDFPCESIYHIEAIKLFVESFHSVYPELYI